VPRRLAFVFGAFPDYCDTGHPHLEGENMPAVPGPAHHTFVANKNTAINPAPRAAPVICRPQAMLAFMRPTMWC
jgi:alkaline phosphatase